MDTQNQKPIIIWLATGCFLIALMVVVGGITRLTHSGLSMVEWKLFVGSIPPLSQQDWLETFNQYKQTPEFKIQNFDFSLEEFKSIFWWEYIHRLLGRMIGVVFIFPFLYFLLKKKLSALLTRKLLFVFALGCFQGFLGWFMVKSGLIKDPNVSHYRLAGHLIIAFILYCYTLWILLELVFPQREKDSFQTRLLKKYSVALLIITFIQVIYGAFVSGLKAGSVYNTFPKMGDRWIAESIGFSYNNVGMISLFENLASVQFIHRYLAFIILFGALFIWFRSQKVFLHPHQKLGVNLVMAVVLVQFLLGVLTLLYSVPLTLAVLHQMGALLLPTAIIYFLFHLNPKSSEVGL